MDFVKVFIFLTLVYLNCLITPVLSADDHDEAGDFCYLDKIVVQIVKNGVEFVTREEVNLL